MKLQDMISPLELKALTHVEDKEVEGIFISDMLSDVMSSAKAGDLWLTVQTHKNIVSAANLVDMAAIVVTHGKSVPKETVDLADRFHVAILSCDGSNFELSAKLHAIGFRPR
jgi:predicted transcriptional regulator